MTDTIEPPKVATNTSIYESAYAAFVPAADDNPENVPFYRAWAGFKAVLISHGVTDPHKAPINVHQICCWADKNGTYHGLLPAILNCTPNLPAVTERRVSCFYRSEPSLPTEQGRDGAGRVRQRKNQVRRGGRQRRGGGEETSGRQ